MDRPVPPWEMMFWNDEWAPHLALLLIVIIVTVQYSCGHGFELFHDYGSLSWLASFMPTCMLSHPCHCAIALPCGSGALLSCYAVVLSFFLPFFLFPFSSSLLLFWLIIPSGSFLPYLKISVSNIQGCVMDCLILFTYSLGLLVLNSLLM
jgi:hypothetical protein